MFDSDNRFWGVMLVFFSVVITLGVVGHLNNTIETQVKKELFQEALDNNVIEYRLNNKTGKVELIKV
jgi:hypothetical protein